MEHKTGQKSFLRTGIVLLIFIFTTISFAAITFSCLKFIIRMDTESIWFGLIVFFVTIASSGYFLNLLVKLFLYPKERAELQLIGGIRYGTHIQTFFSGRTATWPFVKLLATNEKIWIHTPWGTHTYNKLQFQKFKIYSSFLFQSLAIYEEGTSAPVVIFSFLARNPDEIVQTLMTLGYRLT